MSVASDRWAAQRAEFFAARKSIIGGSDAAAILGLSRWRTPFDVWADKVGLIEPSTEMTMRQFIGLRLEPLLGEMAAARLGRPFRRSNRLIRSKAYPFIGGHVDFVGLEVKTSYSAEGWGESGTAITAAERESWDAVPIDYLLQEQHYLYVTGWPGMTIAVLIGHDDFRTYAVEPIPELAEPMIAEEVRFWTDHVVTGLAPSIDASEGAKAYLRSRFPRATGDLRAATPEESILIEDVRQATKATREATEAEETAKNILKGRIGESLGLTAPGVSVTWPTIERKADTNWEAVAAAYRRLLLDFERALGSPESTATLVDDLDAVEGLHRGTPTSYRRLNVAYSRR